MKFSWPRLDYEAATPRITDDLSRGVYRFPNRRMPRALLVVSPDGARHVAIGLRVVTEAGTAIIADARREFDDAVAIAAFLRLVTIAEAPITLRRTLENLAGILVRGGDVPRVRRRFDSVGRSELLGDPAAHDPFDRARLEAGLRTNAVITQESSRKLHVYFGDIHVTIATRGTKCGVLVSSSAEEYWAGVVDRGVATAILHVLDAERRRRDAGGVGPDLLREVVARVALAQTGDSLSVYRSAADLACEGLWSRFVGRGLGSDAGLAAAVMYDAVEYARVRGPGGDVGGLIESVLGAPRSVSPEGAKLWSSDRGWVEVRRAFEGIGFADLAVTAPHGIERGQVALDGPQAVATAVAVALVGLAEGSERAYALRMLAERAQRRFIRGRADIAESFGWFTEPACDSPFEGERSTEALLTRWQEVKRLGELRESGGDTQ